MDQRLLNGLEFVSRNMPLDADPWWIIGSAALVLSGVKQIIPEDIDVVSTKHTLERFLQNAGAAAELPKPHHLFRSDPFGRIQRKGALDVEVQGDLEVYLNAEWRPLQIATRLKIDMGDSAVYVPSLLEQAAIFRSFGRQKDMEKLAMIERHQALP